MLGDGSERSDHTLEQARAAYAAGDWSSARALIAARVDADDAHFGDMQELLGVCCMELGAVDAGARAFEAAFAAFVRDGRPRRAARTTAHLVAVYELLGALAACRGWEQRGLRVISGLAPCVERGYLALAWTGCEIHDPAELEERAELALRLAVEFGDHDLQLRAQGEKGLALVGQGFVNAGFALLDEVMVAVTAGEIRDPHMRGRTVCSMLSACERTGDIARADYWCTRIEQATAEQHAIVLTHCRLTRGAVDGLRGDWTSAEQQLQEALRATRSSRYHKAMAAAKLAEIRLQQGRPDDAADLLAGYEDRFETLPARARLRFAQGQHEQAGVLLRSALRDLGDDIIRLAPILALLIEVDLRRDDVAAADESLGRMRTLEANTESEEIRAQGMLSSGRIARHRGDVATAVTALESALSVLARCERPLLTAQVRLELARALAAALDPVAAQVEAEAALTTFRWLGVVPERQSAEQLLETLGPNAEAGRPTGATEPLTRREREVAHLVADGFTNREIADRLVLSVRTVEGHVDRVLGKLGMHTRTQLAMWVGPAPGGGRREIR